MEEVFYFIMSIFGIITALFFGVKVRNTKRAKQDSNNREPISGTTEYSTRISTLEQRTEKLLREIREGQQTPESNE